MLTNLQLVDFCKKAENLRAKYWYGTFWQKASQSILSSKTNQYPSHYVSSRTATYKSHISAGKMVCDCVGLIKGFFWSENGAHDSKYATNGFADRSADNTFKLCTESGKINTIPEIPGLVVWNTGHIGVYIGSGYAIEARGFNYGVVKTKVKDRSWTHWGKLPMLNYVGGTSGSSTTPPSPTSTSTPALKKGDSGVDVTRMQNLLLAHGLALPKYGADGGFGDETYSAIRKFQSKHGLTIDGICGAKTWAALLSDINTVTHEDQDEDDPDAVASKPEPTKETNNPYAEPTNSLAKGSKGNGVRWVQWALNNAGYSCGKSGIDGDFGGNTHAAVLNFQSDKKLEVDGIVGPKTRVALKSNTNSSSVVIPSKPTDLTASSSTMIIDLSQHNDLKNTKNDWAKIAKNVGLVVLRCGVTRTTTAPKGIGIDDHFVYAAQKCIDYGIPFGVYYYGKVSSTSEAKKEAQKAYSVASPYKPLFYVYDVEESCLTNACVEAWIAEMRKLGAKKVGVYVAHNMYSTFKTGIGKADFAWIPRYGKNTGDYDSKYAPSYPCDIHQYTSVGKVTGLNDNTIDLNRLTESKTLEWFIK